MAYLCFSGNLNKKGFNRFYFASSFILLCDTFFSCLKLCKTKMHYVIAFCWPLVGLKLFYSYGKIKACFASKQINYKHIFILYTFIMFIEVAATCGEYMYVNVLCMYNYYKSYWSWTNYVERMQFKMVTLVFFVFVV